MGLFKDLRLKAKYFKRIGAFGRAKESGMNDADARAYVDSLYPPTPEDLKYEARQEYRERQSRKRGN